MRKMNFSWLPSLWPCGESSVRGTPLRLVDPWPPFAVCLPHGRVQGEGDSANEWTQSCGPSSKSWPDAVFSASGLVGWRHGQPGWRGKLTMILTACALGACFQVQWSCLGPGAGDEFDKSECSSTIKHTILWPFASSNRNGHPRYTTDAEKGLSIDGRMARLRFRCSWHCDVFEVAQDQDQRFVEVGQCLLSLPPLSSYQPHHLAPARTSRLPSLDESASHFLITWQHPELQHPNPATMQNLLLRTCHASLSRRYNVSDPNSTLSPTLRSGCDL